MQKNSPGLWRRQTWLFLLFVMVLSYFTYFHRYWQPRAVFWDENYHIASAQKYLNRVYFMEPHPPLGKLLMAGGEWLLRPNTLDNQFIGTDYATNFPEDFSFAGYRLPSALLGWWTAGVLFLIFLLIFRNPIPATLFSFFYIFDNAMIVHTRGAMIEGLLLFESASMMLLFLLLYEYRNRPRLFVLFSLLFGAMFGALMTTKLLGLLFILLLPIYLLWLWPNVKKMLLCSALFGIGFLCVYVPVWQVHFSLGQKIVSTLPDDGYYQASPEYKKILAEHTQGSLGNFPMMLKDSWNFVGHYNSGTPRLDLCKKDENGSPWYFWPLGARTINYRWETPDGKSYKYLYLMSNPMVWWMTFAGVCLAAALLISRVFRPEGDKLKHGKLFFVFFALYGGFFYGVSHIDRVLYLYHYFIGLLIGMVILALFIDELKKFWKWTLGESEKLIILMVMAGLVFISFQFYRPFTYYEPLTREQFERRNLFSLWELQCIGCEKISRLVVPNK